MTAAFDRLARPVQRWVRNQGWRELRDIQARAVHSVLDAEQDVIIAASTAGGKTEAAFLPLISQVLGEDEGPANGFRLLYVGPLKALINDQQHRLEEICEGTGLPVYPWHGDVSSSVKARAQKAPNGVLMITPESLEAMFVRKGTQIPTVFGRLSGVVIDELHTVLDTERGIHLRSLLARLELALGRPIRRIGLSATLGDMDLARSYLRPEAPDRVEVLTAQGGESELQLQLRGYLSGSEDEGASTTQAVTAHLFGKLRGSDNLVFAGARNRVELYADRMRCMCEEAHLPQEFYPHHASLSREHREFVEKRLKNPNQPTTAVCTSTLELGIDIGDVACISQVGAPFTVASLRQRLGRSGRRGGQPAILRQYAVEAAVDTSSNVADRLRLGLVRAIAMIDLLLEGWCEPPSEHALHLSTLVHQILSVIAERGGASAKRLFVTLCEKGPFDAVDQPTFLRMLRRIGDPEIGLVEQSPDGLLLLGPVGERLVEHYSFYAVFKSPEEFRLVADGRELGTLPVDHVLSPGMLIIFAGRRWEVAEVHDLERVILVQPAAGGVPPVFGGDPGDIHDTVIERMFHLFVSKTVPVYLDETAARLLTEARANFETLGLPDHRVIPLGEYRHLVATRLGTIKTMTLALALRSSGFKVQTQDGFLEVDRSGSEYTLADALREFANGVEPHLTGDDVNLVFEKFHPYLTRPLLVEDALSSKLDMSSLPGVSGVLLQDM